MDVPVRKRGAFLSVKGTLNHIRPESLTDSLRVRYRRRKTVIYSLLTNKYRT